MSGNHNAKAKSAKLTKLERVCEEEFYRHYDLEENWFKKFVEPKEKAARSEMAAAIWDAYQKGFYDGFAAKLSGVSDDEE